MKKHALHVKYDLRERGRPDLSLVVDLSLIEVYKAPLLYTSVCVGRGTMIRMLLVVKIGTGVGSVRNSCHNAGKTIQPPCKGLGVEASFSGEGRIGRGAINTIGARAVGSGGAVGTPRTCAINCRRGERRAVGRWTEPEPGRRPRGRGPSGKRGANSVQIDQSTGEKPE